MAARIHIHYSLSLFLLYYLGFIQSASGIEFKQVDLGYARYQSNISFDEGVVSFLGIRYAAPPTEQLRWKAPQAPTIVRSVQNATAQPPQCVQAPGLVGSPGTSLINPFRARDVLTPFVQPPTVISEDCLFLNVHTPSNFSSADKLPVLVWIHGGAYDATNASAFPVQDFVQESQHGLVAVQAQYRLGPFGFLAGEEVKAGGDLNVGLLDQQYALQWVQEHISTFGGDPSKVTILGQSAGAGSVIQHLIANGGDTQPPLFRAAMMESPFLPFQYDYNDSIPKTIYSHVVDIAGCSGVSDTLSCLRSVDASLLLQADESIGAANFMMTWPFVPVVDGTFIRERPIQALTKRRVNGDVLYVNTNSHEGSSFVNGSALVSAKFTVEDYVRQLFPRLNETAVKATTAIYSRLGLMGITDEAAAVIGENMFICPAYYALEAFTGRQSYKSEFAIPPGLHAQDLSYIFTNFAIQPTFTDADFEHAFAEAFLAVAISLNPNEHISADSILPAWPVWSGKQTEMLFNMTAAAAPDVHTFQTAPALLARCEYWRALSPHTFQ